MVHFLDPVAPDRLLAITSSADVGVTLLQDSCLNHRYALPNKLFEYISAGISVLGSKLPEISRVIDGLEVGRTAPPNDPGTLAVVLQEMIDSDELRLKWRTNTTKLSETFSAVSASHRFEAEYKQLLPTGP